MASAEDETEQEAGHGPEGVVPKQAGPGVPRGWLGRAQSGGGPKRAIAQAELGCGPEALELISSLVGNLRVTQHGALVEQDACLGSWVLSEGEARGASMPPPDSTGDGDDPQ